MEHYRPWSKADVKRLSEYVAGDMSYELIGRKLGRTAKSCKQMARKLRRRGVPSICEARRPGPPIIWNEAACEQLLKLHDEGWQWEEVAAEIGLPIGACVSQYHKLKARHMAADGVTGVHKLASNAAIIDRDKRDAARLRQTITQACFGDPPPGYSALDKRRAV